MKRRFFGRLSIVTGASLAASSFAPMHTFGQSPTKIRYTLGWLIQGLDSPLAIAIARGYFREEGLEVTFERGFGSADSIAKVAAGAYDLGTGEINSMIEFNARNPNSQLRAVIVTQDRSPMCLVSLKSSGLTSPKDLEGKRLGTAPGSGATRMMPLYAKATGIDMSKVEIVSLEPRLLDPFLVQGRVDALAGFIPTTVPNLQAIGASPDQLDIFPFSDYLDIYGGVVVAPLKTIEEKPEIVRGFVRAYLTASADAFADPERAVELLSRFDDSMNKEVEIGRFKLAIEEVMMTDFVRQNGYGGIDEERLARSIQQVAEAFDIANPPSPREVFDPSFLTT